MSHQGPSRPTRRDVSRAALARRGLARPSFYLRDDVYDDAKSAFIVDFDLLPGGAETFTEWVAHALSAHFSLRPERRAALTEGLPLLTPLPSPGPGERRRAGTRNFILPLQVTQAMDAAISADRRQLRRAVSRSEFATEALRIAVRAAMERNGGSLPPAPASIPRNMPRGP